MKIETHSLKQFVSSKTISYSHCNVVMGFKKFFVVYAMRKNVQDYNQPLID